MSAKSSIEWTDATWTPIRARVRSDAAQIARDKGYASLVQIAETMAGHVGPHCEHASPGCDHCYSEAANKRCLPANGTGLLADEIIRLRRSRGDYGVVVPVPSIDPGAVWWPLPHVWLGVSCEDQQRADERIPDLLQTPASVRFVSAEPLLGPMDLFSYLPCAHEKGGCALCREWDVSEGIDWVIIGGESGRHARPCDVAHVRSLVEQCEAAGVACFVKQLGSQPLQPREGDTPVRMMLIDRKGGNPDEWPADLRVRQMPEIR